jgi:hypothetical protein
MLDSAGIALAFTAGITNPGAVTRFHKNARTVRLSQVLDSRAGLGECYRDRFLGEIVKNGNRADGDNAGDKAGRDKRTHRVSPGCCIPYLTRFLNEGSAGRTKRRPSSNVQADRAKASVSMSTKARPSEPTRA